jgi:hypothetical protein
MNLMILLHVLVSSFTDTYRFQTLWMPCSPTTLCSNFRIKPKSCQSRSARLDINPSARRSRSSACRPSREIRPTCPPARRACCRRARSPGAGAGPRPVLRSFAPSEHRRRPRTRTRRARPRPRRVVAAQEPGLATCTGRRSTTGGAPEPCSAFRLTLEFQPICGCSSSASRSCWKCRRSSWRLDAPWTSRSRRGGWSATASLLDARHARARSLRHVEAVAGCSCSQVARTRRPRRSSRHVSACGESQRLGDQISTAAPPSLDGSVEARKAVPRWVQHRTRSPRSAHGPLCRLQLQRACGDGARQAP